MKNKPTKYSSIQQPCPMDWNTMQSIKNSNDRFCKHCKKEVKDISELSEAEIQGSLSKGDLCVRATTEQVNTPFAPVQRFGKLGLLVFGLLVGSPSAAQIFPDKQTYTFEQTQLQSDTVTLQGIVKGKKWFTIGLLGVQRNFGYKKLQNVTISVFSEEGLLLAGAYPKKNGTFKITVDRKLLGEHFAVIVDDKSDRNYGVIEVHDLETKDTTFEFFMKERRYITGRYFLTSFE